MWRMKNFLKVLVFLVVLGLGASGASADFDDVYESHPVSDALDFLAEEEIVEGYGDGTFRPLNLINRAEFTKMIVEGFLGETPDEDEYQNCFPDVEEDWYAKYVCFAKEDGWIEGYEDDTFRPADEITRAEAVKIVIAILEWEASEDFETYFSDIDSEEWYSPYLLAADEHGVFDHIDYYISPHELISRANMSTLLYRVLMIEEGEEVEIWEIEEGKELSYEDVLATGIQPAYPGDMEFSTYSQSAYPYGCYAFATKNILDWKYDWTLDVSEVKTAIGWDGTFIWSSDEFEKFAEIYDVDVLFTYMGSAEFFFKKLAFGEPMILYIPYYLNEVNIGHNLVAYSFDEEGVWVADSLSGGVQRHIGYDEVFVDGENYTVNLTQLRKMKAGGEKKNQYGL